MSPRPSSPRALLPYWALLPLPTAGIQSQHGHLPPFVACLLLKDGTMAFGFTLSAAKPGFHDALWRAILVALPEGGFVQAIASRGLGGGATYSLQRGERPRTEPSRAPDAHGERVTYWLGAKRVLRPLADAPATEPTAQARVHHDNRYQTFLRSLAPACAVLEHAGTAVQFLSAPDVLGACQEALYGAASPVDPAQSPWRESHLDSLLARGSLVIDEHHIAWRPPWDAPPRLVQASSVASVEGPQDFGRIAHILMEECPQNAWTWSVCLEKSIQSLQREKLQQRRKWLVALAGNSFFRHEAEHAQQQAEQLLEDIEQQGAQLFRTTVSCLTTAHDVEALQQATACAQRIVERQGARLEEQEQQQEAVVRSALPACGYASPTGLSLLDRDGAHWLPTHTLALEQPAALRHRGPRSA